jgi:hypothetical protein
MGWRVRSKRRRRRRLAAPESRVLLGDGPATFAALPGIIGIEGFAQIFAQKGYLCAIRNLHKKWPELYRTFGPKVRCSAPPLDARLRARRGAFFPFHAPRYLQAGEVAEPGSPFTGRGRAHTSNPGPRTLGQRKEPRPLL